jgi:hypothetical protein
VVLRVKVVSVGQQVLPVASRQEQEALRQRVL